MGKRYKILIIEDDLLIAEMLKEMLLELNYSVVGICKNYQEAIAGLQNIKKIDLVFIDINISSKKTGIDIGYLLKDEYHLPFIYLTSYSDPITIKEAVNSLPQSYLLKPFSKSDLFSAVELVKVNNKRSMINSIVVKDGGNNVKIMANDILYIKSDKNYLEIVTKEKRVVTRCSLESIIEELNDQTIARVHRSYAVNVNSIQTLSQLELIVNDTMIPLSRKYKDEIYAAFKKGS
ncbi:MAG: response regulator transcription factor [Fluviicola sp.]|nr:response regulator transcription factor [Fluviicola sp.]